MADILTLDDARAALRLTDNDSTHDDDLTTTYIPATTALVEGIVGPVMTRTKTAAFNGGGNSLVLPSGVTAVTSVTSGGTVMAASGYFVNLVAGIIYGGTYGATPFVRGIQNIVVTYTAGTAATSADVPQAIKLAARIILAHIYQADQQGFRPQFNGPDMGTTTVGTGYAIPHRAAELLAPFVTPVGFA